jgi:ABC-type phosphate transport system substrate-binding protein
MSHKLTSIPVILVLGWVSGLLNISAVYADVVVVVGSANPIALDRNQIKDIFLGRKMKYPDGSAAVPVDQGDGRPIRSSFYGLLAGKDEIAMKAYWSNLIFTGNGRPPKSVANEVEVKKFLKENPGSIGYIDSKELDSSVRSVLELK